MIFPRQQQEAKEGQDRLRLPPLHLFKVFDAAARRGSFSAASEELCVTPSAVSQQIRQLEDLLDIRLFRRLPRKVELTREGRLLASAVSEALSLIARAYLQINDPGESTILCINAPTSIISRWLMPRLSEFMQLQPHIKVNLLASNDPVDFDRQDIDIAIRWGDGLWPDVHAEKLGSGKLFPVGRPEIISSEATFDQPESLLDHTLLQPIDGGFWTAWFRTTGISSVKDAAKLYFDDEGVMLDAAVHGQGIALADKILVENDLKSGRLVRLHDHEMETDRGYYVLSSRAFSEKPAVIAFRHWLSSFNRNE